MSDISHRMLDSILDYVDESDDEIIAILEHFTNAIESLEKRVFALETAANGRL